MRHLSILLLLSVVMMTANAQTKINITIDNRTMVATLKDNAATRSLIDKLSAGAITIAMTNYGGFEKVGALPWKLPNSDTQITTKPGDIMLYTGNSIVIFYGTNTWSYTPLGVLETTDSAEISNFVGTGTKQVVISLDEPTSLKKRRIALDTRETVYTVAGKLVKARPLPTGIYIVNNKKVIVE